jgi:predicted dithiol-disulfide oxidoreductase (DUF899 family)
MPAGGRTVTESMRSVRAGCTAHDRGHGRVSSAHNRFNFDFNASFTEEQARTGTAFFNYAQVDPGPLDREGVSVFSKGADGTVYRTYSTYGRGIDLLNGAYHYLDLLPKGRDEDSLEFTQSWVRHHDRYDA